MFGQGSFVNDQNATPESIARKRALMAALMPRFGQARYVGEGIGQLATGIGMGLQGRRLNKAENAGRKGAAERFAALFGGGTAQPGGFSILGQGGMGSTPQSQPAAPPMTVPPGMGQTPLSFGGQGQPLPPVMGGDAAVGFNGGKGEMTLPQMRTMDPSRPAPIGERALGFGGADQPMQYPQPIGESALGFGAMPQQSQGGGMGGAGGQFASALLAGGLPQHVVDGILMNARDESGFNPSAVGDGGQAFGLLQWNGPRKRALMDFAAQNGGNPADPAVQAQFTLRELQGPESAAGRAIMSTSNAGEAAAAFVNQFERPAEEHRARREAAYLGGQGMPTQGGGTYPTQGGYSGPAPEQLIAILTDPWATQEQRQVAQLYLAQAMGGGAQDNVPAGFRELDMRAQAAGLQPGTPEYQSFMASGGAGLKEGRPAAFESLHQQALAAGLQQGSPEYQQFMLTKGAGDAAFARETGTQRGQATVNRDGALAKGQQALDLIDQIATDPALEGVTGMIQGRLPTFTQAGTDLRVKIDQLQGKTFLEAFETLKGGGAITELEGAKAQAAMARLDQAQSTEAYREALSELADIVRIGMDRARKKAGASQGQPAPQGQPGGTTLTYNPATGDFE